MKFWIRIGLFVSALFLCTGGAAFAQATYSIHEDTHGPTAKELAKWDEIQPSWKVVIKGVRGEVVVWGGKSPRLDIVTTSTLKGGGGLPELSTTYTGIPFRFPGRPNAYVIGVKYQFYAGRVRLLDSEHRWWELNLTGKTVKLTRVTKA